MLFSAGLEDLYAFHYTDHEIKNKSEGWDLFDIQSEFLRMGVPNENWVLSRINMKYEVRSHIHFENLLKLYTG